MSISSDDRRSDLVRISPGTHIWAKQPQDTWQRTSVSTWRNPIGTSCALSELTGFASPQALCETLAYLLAEPVGVVDLVLWRFATLNRSYLSHFEVCSADRPAAVSKSM